VAPPAPPAPAPFVPGPGGFNTIIPFSQMQQSDALQQQTIQKQMEDDNSKQQMDRWKILQDTQTKIFEIQQDVTINKAKTQDKMYNKWDEYIRN
jgi:hypothetical protein